MYLELKNKGHRFFFTSADLATDTAATPYDFPAKSRFTGQVITALQCEPVFCDLVFSTLGDVDYS